MKNDRSSLMGNNGLQDLPPKYAELLAELKAQIRSAPLERELRYP